MEYGNYSNSEALLKKLQMKGLLDEKKQETQEQQGEQQETATPQNICSENNAGSLETLDYQALMNSTLVKKSQEGEFKTYTLNSTGTKIKINGETVTVKGTGKFEIKVNDDTVTIKATSNSSSISFNNKKDVNFVVEKSDANKTFNLTTGAGNDTVVVAEGAKITTLNTANGDDNVINYGTISTLNTGNGADVVLNKGTVKGNINTGAGADIVQNDGTVSSNINSGTGDDQIINNGSAGSVNGAQDIDVIIDDNTVKFEKAANNITLGENDNAVINSDSSVTVTTKDVEANKETIVTYDNTGVEISREEKLIHPIIVDDEEPDYENENDYEDEEYDYEDEFGDERDSDYEEFPTIYNDSMIGGDTAPSYDTPTYYNDSMMGGDTAPSYDMPTYYNDSMMGGDTAPSYDMHTYYNDSMMGGDTAPSYDMPTYYNDSMMGGDTAPSYDMPTYYNDSMMGGDTAPSYDMPTYYNDSMMGGDTAPSYDMPVYVDNTTEDTVITNDNTIPSTDIPADNAHILNTESTNSTTNNTDVDITTSDFTDNNSSVESSSEGNDINSGDTTDLKDTALKGGRDVIREYNDNAPQIEVSAEKMKNEYEVDQSKLIEDGIQEAKDRLDTIKDSIPVSEIISKYMESLQEAANNGDINAKKTLENYKNPKNVTQEKYNYGYQPDTGFERNINGMNCSMSFSIDNGNLSETFSITLQDGTSASLTRLNGEDKHLGLKGDLEDGDIYYDTGALFYTNAFLDVEYSGSDDYVYVRKTDDNTTETAMKENRYNLNFSSYNITTTDKSGVTIFNAGFDEKKTDKNIIKLLAREQNQETTYHSLNVYRTDCDSHIRYEISNNYDPCTESDVTISLAQNNNKLQAYKEYKGGTEEKIIVEEQILDNYGNMESSKIATYNKQKQVFEYEATNYVVGILNKNYTELEYIPTEVYKKTIQVISPQTILQGVTNMLNDYGIDNNELFNIPDLSLPSQATETKETYTKYDVNLIDEEMLLYTRELNKKTEETIIEADKAQIKIKSTEDKNMTEKEATTVTNENKTEIYKETNFKTGGRTIIFDTDDRKTMVSEFADGTKKFYAKVKEENGETITYNIILDKKGNNSEGLTIGYSDGSWVTKYSDGSWVKQGKDGKISRGTGEGDFRGDKLNYYEIFNHLLCAEDGNYLTSIEQLFGISVGVSTAIVLAVYGGIKLNPITSIPKLVATMSNMESSGMAANYWLSLVYSWGITKGVNAYNELYYTYTKPQHYQATQDYYKGIGFWWASIKESLDLNFCKKTYKEAWEDIKQRCIEINDLLNALNGISPNETIIDVPQPPILGR